MECSCSVKKRSGTYDCKVRNLSADVFQGPWIVNMALQYFCQHIYLFLFVIFKGASKVRTTGDVSSFLPIWNPWDYSFLMQCSFFKIKCCIIHRMVDLVHENSQDNTWRVKKSCAKIYAELEIKEKSCVVTQNV